MITAPNMPLAMWADMGIELQWYSQMPLWVAVNRKVSDPPGATVLMGWSGASIPAWKSME